MPSQRKPQNQTEAFIEKYTGYQVTDLKALMDTTWGKDIVSATIEVATAELFLMEAAAALANLEQKIRKNLDAKPGIAVLDFYPMGEVNGSKIGTIDLLLERRRSAIMYLRMNTFNAVKHKPQGYNLLIKRRS